MSNAWFALYPGDYGRKTAHLSVVENGAYLLLLIHCYATGRPLPKDKAALYRIVRAHDEVERAAVDSVVAQFFVLREHGYHNDRATEELAKRAELKQRLSTSGRKGAQKKWGIDGHASSLANDLAIGHPKGEASSLSMANPQPQPQSQEEPKNIPAPKAVRASEPVGFLKFWEAYPVGRRVDRRDAFRAWMKGGLELFTDQILAGLAKWVYCEQWASDQFIPHPATFLNKRRWEAEPPRDTVNRDASVGKYDPARPVKPMTAEDIAEMDRMRIENERWDGLEKGTLPVNKETVAWVKDRHERFAKVRLPAADPRPKWFKAFWERATASGMAA